MHPSLFVSSGGAFLALLILALGCGGPESAQSPPVTDDDPLGQAFDVLVAELRAVEEDMRRSPSFGDEAEQVGAYRHVLRSVAKGLEAEVRQDPDYPYFRILDWWLREGGDNPDQRYAFSPIRGGETYRVWGELGSAARLEFQIYAGRPWDGSGQSAGYLAFEDIDFDDDGGFEIWVSAEKRDGNWLSNPKEGTTLFARHIYDDWDDARTGDVHIDRVGYEGRRRPAESAEELATRIRSAAEMFGATARTWPVFLNRRYVENQEKNSVAPPYDTYALGGAQGRWMSGGYFELVEGQALLLRLPATAAKYQAVQLTDMWFASLEHGNQVSSLNTTQSVVGDDGAYYFVISNEDPGYANWLDAGALRRGTFLIRWDGISGALSPDRYPKASLVSLDSLAERIPGYVRVEESDRVHARQARRRHLQLRSHR